MQVVSGSARINHARLLERLLRLLLDAICLPRPDVFWQRGRVAPRPDRPQRLPGIVSRNALL